MSVVKINAITVPEGMGGQLEERFARRAHRVEGMEGFEGFELLRPVGGETRYFVYTRWRSEEDFQRWVSGQEFKRGHPAIRFDHRAPTGWYRVGSAVVRGRRERPLVGGWWLDSF